MANKQKPQDNRIVIDGELTIYTAMELKAKFLASLLKNDVLELDLSNVNEFDGAGLQLLIMAKQDANATNKVLRISGRSPAVVELLNLSGLTGFFCD